MFFSKNTKEEIKEFVKGTFGAQIIQHHEKYLGLPPLVGRAKKKAFNCIKDQVGRKIQLGRESFYLMGEGKS